MPSQGTTGGTHYLQGAHLIHVGAGEVELGEGAVVAIRHVHPATEEDQGARITDQGPQEHFNVGLLLDTQDGDWLRSLLTQALKSPSRPSLEPWVSPALQPLSFPNSTLFPSLTRQTLPSTQARTHRQVLHEVRPQSSGRARLLQGRGGPRE